MIFLEVLRFISGDAGLEQHQALVAVLSVLNLSNLLETCQEFCGGTVEAAVRDIRGVCPFALLAQSTGCPELFTDKPPERGLPQV